LLIKISQHLLIDFKSTHTDLDWIDSMANISLTCSKWKVKVGQSLSFRSPNKNYILMCHFEVFFFLVLAKVNCKEEILTAHILRSGRWLSHRKSVSRSVSQ